MKRILTIGGTVLALLAASSQLVGTAQAQGVPGPTREEIQRDRLDERLRQPAEPLAVESEDVERAPCPLADPQFATLRFTLRTAVFSGAEVLESGMLDLAYRDLVGQDLPVAAVCEIRDRAATILRRAGYLAAVQVPPQTIEDGAVRFDVVLARMRSVQVRGDAGPSERALQTYIDKLTAQPLFNIGQAERYLLLARDIPGLDVRLTLQPASREGGAGPGEVVGVFDVVRTPYFVDANVENYGSKAVGRFGGLARVRFNGLTGLADETVVSFFSTLDTGEQEVIQASHTFRLGGEGLTLGGSFTYAWTRPDIPGPDAFRSRTLVASAYAAYPFVRRQTVNLSATFGFDLIDQNVSFTGLDFSRDRLRVAFARLDFGQVDRDSILGRNGYSPFEPRLAMTGSVELRQGIGLLGASKGCGPGFMRCLQPGVVPPGNLDGDPTAFVARAEAQIDYRLYPALKFTLRGRAQYSPDALLSYEELSGGNYTVGRRYDPGAIVGDSGVGAQAEVAYGSLIPKTPDGVALQPFLFVDYMGVYNKFAPGDPQRLASAGGGLRATIGRQGRLEALFAAPLKRTPVQARRGDTRFLVSLTMQLAPWRR